jgi:hypothetical protein
MTFYDFESTKVHIIVKRIVIGGIDFFVGNGFDGQQAMRIEVKSTKV